MARQVQKRPSAAAAKRKPTRRKPQTGTRRKSTGNGIFTKIVAPLVLLLVILGCLGFLLFMGYRTVTASSFFDARLIEIRGANRVSREEVERIVRAETARTSVWNADVEAMREQIEKMAFVKSVSVSRVLPDGVRVNVTERVPRAVIGLETGEVWVDDDGTILGRTDRKDLQENFVVRGWDENKSEKAAKDNRERVKIAVRIREDLKQTNIDNRVKVLNLSGLQEPQAIVEDSGESVSIFLGKEDFGVRMQKALEVLDGKGKQIESLISHGTYPIARFRSS